MLLRSLAIAAVGLGLGFAAPTVANAYPAFTTGSVNVRTGPGIGYPKITSLPRGTQVDIRGCQPSWCRVGFWSGSGWVSAAYLSAVGPRFERRLYLNRPGLYFRFNFGPQPHPRPWPGPFMSPWWW